MENNQIVNNSTPNKEPNSRLKSIEYKRGSDLYKSRNSEKDTNLIKDRVVYRFKVILLGEVAVGKTSILSRFVEDRFTQEYKCNVGVEFKVKSIFLDEKIGADLQIWDTCGEERFRGITRQYYRDAYGVILIFDLTNKNSFDKLSSWLADIQENGPKETNILIIGNKSDLLEERKVNFNDAYNFASKNNIQYIEVSAKTGNNVGLLFENLTKTMVKKEQASEKKTKNEDKERGTVDRSHVVTNRNITFDNKSINKNMDSNNTKGCCK
jgi:small GTP-binding protein